MKLSSSLVALSLFFSSSLVFGAPNASPKLKESVNPPRGWVKHSPASPDHIIHLRIGLPQPNFDTVERHLFEISDPYHERYGNHMSKEEVEELVAPHPDSVRLVEEWLADHGIGQDSLSQSPAKDWVTIKVPVSVAEKMLHTVGSLLSRYFTRSPRKLDVPRLESHRQ